ncbi:MAG: PH domain-containing protein [Lachnospiraceae bacterium]|nr:PH domain-containing protein [Lachnospiraceae bacterium]
MADIMTEKQNILWKDRRRTIFGLPWTFTKYSLTKERLFIEDGLFNTTEDEIRLYRVLDVKLTRGFFQKMFGLGTIQVASSDQSLHNFQIRNIKKSRDVKELLSELVEKQRNEKRVVNRELMATSDGFADNDEEDIEGAF